MSKEEREIAYKEFIDRLRELDFPKHELTYRAAKDGWPKPEDAVSEARAADLGRGCMFDMLRRQYNQIFGL